MSDLRLDAAEAFAGIIKRLTEERDAALARVEELEGALKHSISVADEARAQWDVAPEGMKAGKLLIALSGNLKGYRADIDAIHAALRKEQGNG